MPTFPFEIQDAQHQPIDVSQLEDDQREALMEDIKEQLTQLSGDANLLFIEDWRVNYMPGNRTFTLTGVEDADVNALRDMEELELQDFAGVFDNNETHYGKAVLPPAGGRKRRGKKSRKSRRKSKKSRLTRRR